MDKQLLLSVTASDCRWDYYRGSGKGGQKRNKTSNCVRCTHEPSGAVGKSEEGRSQLHNRQQAFRKMAESQEFQQWLKIECAKRSGELAKVEDKINKAMDEKNIRTEIHNEKGLWVKAQEISDEI